MMKNYILMIGAVWSCVTFGQTDCQNNVSTDPDAPTNLALPSGVDGDKYLNGFHWIDTTGAGIHNDYTCEGMEFDGVPIEFMNNIMVTGLEDYNYISDGPLHLTENGWDLMLVNLGKYPDDLTPVPTAANNHLPYIVLYNRYSGTVRVFFNFGSDHFPSEGADAMEIELKFPYEDQMSGAFRLYQGFDAALDQKSNVVSMKSIAKAPAVANEWASTDFKIAYDPCTCYYPSEMRLNFTQITSSTISLHGRGIALEDEPLIDNATLQVNPLEYLSGFDHTGYDGEAGGVAIYKTITAMIDDYLEKYEEYNKQLVEVGEHNKKVKRNLAVLKLAKFVIGVAANPISGIVPESPLQAEYAAEAAAAEAAGQSVEEITEAYEALGLSDPNWFKVVENLQDGIIKANAAGAKIIDNAKLFGLVKKIFGEKGETFIANNFETKAIPTRPVIPTATFSEMHYEGLISNESPIGGPQFYTPGTYGAVGTGFPTITEVEQYPVYNEVMGVFALLESPQIHISKNVIYDTEFQYAQGTFHSGSGINDLRIQLYQAWTREYQIKLKENLIFAFNDVLDIKDYEIQAAFNIVATPTRLDMPVEVEGHCYNAPNQAVNMESTSMDLSAYGKIISNYDYIGHLKANPEFDSWRYDPDYIPSAPEVIHSTVNLQTQYLPLDAFKPHVSSVGIRNETVKYTSNHIPTYDWDSYEKIIDPETGIELVDLSDERIEKPFPENPYGSGYGYEFVVELKLIVDVEFNTLNADGTPNTLTEVLTYKIRPEDITYQYATPFVDFLAWSGSNIGQYPFDSYYTDVNFHGQEVEGCRLDGTHYTCRSVNTTTIQGDLTTEGGYTVDILAGNEIYAIPSSSVSPEIVLSIEPILNYSEPQPKSTQEEVTAFCNGEAGKPQLYAANSSPMAGRRAPVDQEGNGFDKIETIDMLVFPNPTRDHVTVVFNNEQLFEPEISLLDLTGKQVPITVNKENYNRYSVDLSDCAPGTYFVVLQDESNQLTKRLVVQ